MSDLLSRTLSAPPDSPEKHGDPVDRLRELLVKAKLQEVASSRGRQYGRYIAILTYWELDNTNARQDAQTMSTLLEACFSFDVVKTTMIRRDDPYPMWTVEGTLQDLLRKEHDPKTPTLLVFYYAGDGTMFEREFYLANGRKRILWSRLQQTIFGEMQFEVKENRDSLVILDCCFSGNFEVSQKLFRANCTDISSNCWGDIW